MERRFSHGNIHDSKSIHLKPSILKMNKDYIKGCSECEFRYCCFDCRPDSLTEDIFSKPWYCTYNPEIGTWEDLAKTTQRFEKIAKVL